MRKRNKRLILLLVIFLCLGGVGYKVAESIWIMKVREVRGNPLKALDDLSNSGLHIKDFSRAKVEDGRKIWELIGDEANYFKEQKEAIIKNPKFYYYDTKGETAETTGATAHLFFNERELEKMELQGGVQVSYQGYVLKSKEAIYLPAEERIVLPTRTIVAGNGLELEGSRMEVELASKKLRMLQNVKSRVEPDNLAKRNKKFDGTAVSGG
jgi:LPS export ABC transporter protein LptC